MTWTGWDRLRNLADQKGIIYKRGDSNTNSYIQAIDDLLMLKNATDVGLIFEDERGILLSIILLAKLCIATNVCEIDSYRFPELNQSLYYLIGNSIIRLVVIDDFTEKTVSKIRAMRPSPSYYAIYANTAKMDDLFKTVTNRNHFNPFKIRRKLAGLFLELLNLFDFSFYLSLVYLNSCYLELI